MLLSEIQLAVINRLENASGILPVAFPREDGFKNNGQPYARVMIVPFDNRQVVHCDSVMRSGFILINVVYPDNSGVVVPTQSAEKFVELFSKGSAFDGVAIGDGNIRGTVNDDDHEGWFFVPVLIYFEAM